MSGHLLCFQLTISKMCRTSDPLPYGDTVDTGHPPLLACPLLSLLLYKPPLPLALYNISTAGDICRG